MDNTLQKSSSTNTEALAPSWDKRRNKIKSKTVGYKPLREIQHGSINQINAKIYNQDEVHKQTMQNKENFPFINRNIKIEDDVFINYNDQVENKVGPISKHNKLTTHRTKMVQPRRKMRRAISSPFPCSRSSSKSSLCYSVLKKQHGMKCTQRLGGNISNKENLVEMSPSFPNPTKFHFA